MYLLKIIINVKFIKPTSHLGQLADAPAYFT